MRLKRRPAPSTLQTESARGVIPAAYTIHVIDGAEIGGDATAKNVLEHAFVGFRELAVSKIDQFTDQSKLPTALPYGLARHGDSVT